MIRGGSTVPSIVINAPNTPAILYPTIIEVLTAMAPGADCEIATRFNISSSSIHLSSSTNFFLISGTITYPPPMVKALRVNVDQNNFK